jgi:hypothetical protein
MEKLLQLFQAVSRTFKNNKTILFYPNEPLDFHIMWKILRFLGHRITSDPQKQCDLAFRWWRGFDGNPFAPQKTFPQLRANGPNGIRVLNIHCTDVSKTRVNSVFEEVFGYSIAANPQKHSGKCVMKRNGNGLHEGQIIDCPVSLKDDDFIYQKLIHNETNDGFVEDMRVPVYGNRTPFVYLKYRSVKDRLVDRVHTNTNAKMVETSKVLSQEELNNIYQFCEKIGLDCGEVDVLRDKDDGQIYIVDVNNFPSGPPSPISENEGRVAILRLAQTFEEVFGV